MHADPLTIGYFATCGVTALTSTAIFAKSVIRKFRSRGKHVYDHSWSYDQMLNQADVNAYLTHLSEG